ncbi:MAG: heat-inducible transcriptional repressor HrcA [Deltaproteobacteria bacterium]
MLTHRSRRILFALVSEYIATGEAVASQALVGTHGLELSSASIRAVFLELEGQGYVAKLHASAGRIPTERALRAFVDALLASTQLPQEVREKIESRFQSIAPGLENALKHTGRVLAEVTGAAAVVVASGLTWTLRDLRFISIAPNDVLVVIVSTDGGVQNRVVRLEQSITASELERSNNLLQSLLGGRSLVEMRHILAEQLESERGRFDATVCLALTLGERALGDLETGDVFVEGHAQLIGRPEFGDIDRARSALRTLEDKERLVQLLDRTLAAPGLQVVIGAEDEATGAGDLSMVAAPFGSGAIGVIGSTRMDYSQVLPAVRFTAALLRRMSGSERGGSGGSGAS